MRPLLPHLLPLVVCLLCVPVLMFLSGAAGLAVWNSVPVGWKVETYLQYGDAVNPFAITQLPPIFANQPYDVSLHLVLPATEANYALGNFMTTLRLSTTYNESLITVRRSTALVPPRTSLLKQFVLGSQPIIKLDIPLLSQFVAGSTNIIAYLELGRPDAWKNIGSGQQREISIAQSTLKGTVRPTGIRAIRARYPRLTTFLSTFIFFFVSIMVVTGFLFFAIGGKPSTHPPSMEENEDSESDRVDDTHDNDYFKPRLAKRGGYRDQESESDSRTNEDHTPNIKSEDNFPPSGLRVRRTTQVRHRPIITSIIS
ncbi:hypothetical protein BU17DRAFT_74550 [Hysterangium stoloniferum]|nr:hypothetical protein BU17DRAFT_74550 [Hysterangium stoloniferum]